MSVPRPLLDLPLRVVSEAFEPGFDLLGGVMLRGALLGSAVDRGGDQRLEQDMLDFAFRVGRH
jgi:hypothetical protein